MACEHCTKQQQHCKRCEKVNSNGGMLQEACSSPDDLLPGLCALAQRWLGDVALPGFRDAPANSGTLTDWFNDRGVAMYLQVSCLQPITDVRLPPCGSAIASELPYSQSWRCNDCGVAMFLQLRSLTASLKC